MVVLSLIKSFFFIMNHFTTNIFIDTVLNKCNKFKSFVYSDIRYKEETEEQVIEIDVKPRKNAKAICSSCHKPGQT